MFSYDLGQSRTADDHAISQRDACPTPAGQSLVGRSGLHDQVVADSQKPTDPETQEPPSTTTNELDPLRYPGDAVIERHCERRTKGQLGSLGSVASTSDHAVCLEEEPRHDLLRISETVDLFNSTPIGRVLNERQLLRHRSSANHTFVVGTNHRYSARIDVVRYVAWLTDRMHAGIDGHLLEGDISCHGVYALLAKQNYCCALTGRPLRPSDASLDHVLPVSRQGLHRLENAQVLHQDVNRAKGTLTNVEFVALCREVAAWADHQSTTKDIA